MRFVQNKAIATQPKIAIALFTQKYHERVKDDFSTINYGNSDQVSDRAPLIHHIREVSIGISQTSKGLESEFFYGIP
jgi:hypothetical protein